MISYALTFIEGVLTFISPCILPMLPVYFMYLAGTAGGTGSAFGSQHRLYVNAFGFAAGFTAVFLLFGATAAAIGNVFENNRTVLQIISGTVMVLFGLNILGALKLKFLNREKRLPFNPENMNFLKSLLFGMAFVIGWSPCFGPFLGSAMMLAGQSGTIGKGILLLFVYSAGLAVPFLLSAVIFNKAKGAFEWLKKNSNPIRILSGILLILTGILVLTGRLNYLF